MGEVVLPLDEAPGVDLVLLLEDRPPFENIIIVKGRVKIVVLSLVF